MTDLPILAGKDLIRILGRVGYREARQRGSHIRLSCPGRNSVTVSNYKAIDRSLLRKILRDAELTAPDFGVLLGNLQHVAMAAWTSRGRAQAAESRSIPHPGKTNTAGWHFNAVARTLARSAPNRTRSFSMAERVA